MATNLNVQLWIRFGYGYRHALSIPVHECQRFSLHPLTWLRFLGYAIYGKEGYLSRERDGEQVADYRPDGVAIWLVIIITYRKAAISSKSGPVIHL
jgi:hypothetical protein